MSKKCIISRKCDELIKYFWENKDKHDDGKVEHFVNGEYQVS